MNIQQKFIFSYAFYFISYAFSFIKKTHINSASAIFVFNFRYIARKILLPEKHANQGKLISLSW